MASKLIYVYFLIQVSSAKVVEHLVQHIQEESNTQEIFHAISSSGSQISDYKIREFEVETERLNSKIEHLKSQNDLLTLTLEESKTNCDRLSVLLGKYESNNTALQLVMNYNDQALETTELLLRLLETEIGLVVAKCHAAGMATLVRTCGDCDLKEEAAAILKRAQEKRKSIESLAKRFLQRLDRNFPNAAFTNCSDRPWEDLSSRSHTARWVTLMFSLNIQIGETHFLRNLKYVVFSLFLTFLIWKTSVES